MTFVSRAEALAQLGAPDRWQRNYGLERDMRAATGGEYVINEWCPTDGIYCAWLEHAPIASFLDLLSKRAENGPAGFTGDLGRIAAEIKKRTPDNR